MLARGTSEQDDGRDGQRRNMLIAAVLHAAEGVSPVRIRNMSSHGALVEAPVLPPAGAEVELVRGSLRARGRLVWSEGNRCGIRLDAEVTVADWIAPPRNAQQAAVDWMIAEVRSGRAEPVAQSVRSPSALDLGQAAALVEDIAEALSADPAVLVRHAASLQRLDQLRGMLEGLARR